MMKLGKKVPSVNLYNLSFINKFFFIKIISIIYFFNNSFFIFQNLTIFPYNYIWINNFSHFTKVQNIFELDYWSVSTKNVSKFIKKDNYGNACIISNRNDAIDTLIPGENCLIDFRKLHKKNKRPFYVSLMGRGIKKGVPNDCDLVFEEKTKINFSSEILSMLKFTNVINY